MVEQLIPRVQVQNTKKKELQYRIRVDVVLGLKVDDYAKSRGISRSRAGRELWEKALMMNNEVI